MGARPQAPPRGSSELRSKLIEAAFKRGLERYEVRAQPFEIHLFRPKLEIAYVLGPDRWFNSLREPVSLDNGWTPFAPRVSVHEVPGDHDSMVLEPNVRVLAAKIRHCMEAVEQRAGASTEFEVERQLELVPTSRKLSSETVSG